MNTCLIYGQNGLDLDVAFNLRAFYKKLGYWTVFSETLVDADLLVILRAVDSSIENIETFQFGQIHVYDYGGWKYDACIRSLDYKKTHIFTTSENMKQHLINDLSFPSSQILITFPPVEVSLWIEKRNRIRYDIVHIGNYKKIDSSDIIREKFNQIILKYNVDVWGLGWTIQKQRYHGKAGLFRVSKIYSKSNFALGLMYPFQRNVTFSGRFWHAPLNGCVLLSEPGLYTQMIPGVIEVDYSDDSVIEMVSASVMNSDVQNQSIEFWNKHNDDFKKVVSVLLVNNKRTIFNGFFVLLYFRNFLRFLYQKYQLFKLFS